MFGYITKANSKDIGRAGQGSGKYVGNGRSMGKAGVARIISQLPDACRQ
jgi:hypothetical protein